MDVKKPSLGDLKCKLCESRDVFLLDRFSGKEIGAFIPRFNKTYKKNFSKDLAIVDDDVFLLVRCRSCTFSFIANPLSSKNLHKLYEEIIDSSATQKISKQSEHRSLFLNIWLDILAFTKSGQVLDIGCGWGEFLQIGLSLGFKCYGYEFDQKKYPVLKSLGVKMLDQLDKSNKKYDFILANQVLEHVTDPVFLVRTCRNILSDKGRLLIAVPNCSNLGKKITKTLNPLEHINYFTPKSLRTLLVNAGFKVQDYYPLRFENWQNPIGIAKELVKAFLNKLPIHSLPTRTAFVSCRIAK